MACTLDEFCAEASGLLKSDPLPGALEAIARRLHDLLSVQSAVCSANIR